MFLKTVLQKILDRVSLSNVTFSELREVENSKAKSHFSLNKEEMKLLSTALLFYKKRVSKKLTSQKLEKIKNLDQRLYSFITELEEKGKVAA